MNNNEIKAEAIKLINEFDAGSFENYVEERSAEALADFWIEYQFARVDIECDWSDEKCSRMHKRMKAALNGLGLA